MNPFDHLTRRKFVGVTAAGVTLAGLNAGTLEAAPSAGSTVHCSLNINGQVHNVDIDPRVTLLDLLREQLHMPGTHKGCDHGQCGACTVISNGRRINSCLALAFTEDGHKITTIEGLASGNDLHPMQTAFIERDGFQCGFCTSGQICSAVAMLDEWKAGMPSAVGPGGPKADFNDAQVRERMAGNICRCGAYPNIVAAIHDVQSNTPHGSNRI